MTSPLHHNTISPNSTGITRIVVVADTHSRPHPGSLAHIAAMAPDAILHAGDIGDLAVLDTLVGLAPVYAVRGNIDGHTLPDARVIDVGGLRVLLRHIGLRGPRIRADAARQAGAADAGLLVCGHSHVPFIGRDRGLGVFNPGSVGPRRFSLPIVFGVLELREDGAHLGHVDAESGAPWLPP